MPIPSRPPVLRSGARLRRTRAAPRLASRAALLSRARRRGILIGGAATSGGQFRAVVVLVAIVALAVVALPALGVGAVGTAAIVTVDRIAEELPDPSALEDLSFAEPTTVWDRSGKVQLGIFQKEQRRVVTFDEVPRLVLDATTTAEDRSFWTNSGFDPAAILSAVAENVSGTGDRGGSTITQQLVRARLLPPDVVAPGADRYRRKVMELVQSWRLTNAYPGEAGKEK